MCGLGFERCQGLWPLSLWPTDGGFPDVTTHVALRLLTQSYSVTKNQVTKA